MGGHTNAEQRKSVQGLLAGLSAGEVAAVGLEALRRWWRGRPDDSLTFQLHGDFGRQFVLVVGEQKQLTVDAHSWKEPFLYDQHEPWMADVNEFLWSLTRAGFVVPLLHGAVETAGYPVQMRVTRAGARLLAATGDELVLPDGPERARRRCPGLSDSVFLHILDARACIDHALARPAVVLLGLAYETAIEEVVQKLIERSVLGEDVERHKAAKRIAAVRQWLNARRDSEAKFAAIAAWAFADDLRRRRNDGSHTRPAYDFTDDSEVHELFVSALRSLPALWSVTTFDP
jgi:hypothetical protein